MHSGVTYDLDAGTADFVCSSRGSVWAVEESGACTYEYSGAEVSILIEAGTLSWMPGGRAEVSTAVSIIVVYVLSSK